jgi:hypothetical protein
MKIPANYQNPAKISHPDKVEREVVFSRLRDASECRACVLAWGLRSGARSALLGCPDHEGQQEPMP